MVYYTAENRAELQVYHNVDGSYKHNLNKRRETYKRSYNTNQCIQFKNKLSFRNSYISGKIKEKPESDYLKG